MFYETLHEEKPCREIKGRKRDENEFLFRLKPPPATFVTQAFRQPARAGQAESKQTAFTV